MKPDPDLDVSDAVLASMELGVRSFTWDMVKQEFVKDKTSSDLVGSQEVVKAQLKTFLRTSNHTGN